ncbi:PREDICTED: uncharacterized protein LOC107194600 [Dufourea novaeangliae]|uniref:Uncharacterized protein n=1 Tax=Dufourea novaeangliae TaxID=178035 RepID=A0A154P5Q8_DUFNO|nr:PREDICTED: uncharacterized protein LOC107194600 [Dufourea novaeangliae]KZC06528.1 hypothetical protein WN55_10439 [Dufourea novaeangliae]
MSCFGGRDERLYMLSMLVHKLTLTKGKINDIGEFPVAIKIKFLHFPVFEITREDFYAYKPPPPEDEGCTLRFMIGRSCMFVMQPKELVHELQSTIVKVGVFRVGDTYPTAETEITLPGCLCDQVAMSQNDTENLPKPFVVKDKYNLIDPGDNPSGTLEMEMTLVCLGRSYMTHYEMHPQFFAFRNQDKEREFCVRRLVPPSYHPDGVEKDISQFPDRTTLNELRGIDPNAQRKKGKKGKKKKKGGKKKGKK